MMTVDPVDPSAVHLIAPVVDEHGGTYCGLDEDSLLTTDTHDPAKVTCRDCLEELERERRARTWK